MLNRPQCWMFLPMFFISLATIPVWFDAKALLAISDSILNTSLLDLAAKLICQGGEQGLPFLLGLSSAQFLHLLNG